MSLAADSATRGRYGLCGGLRTVVLAHAPEPSVSRSHPIDARSEHNRETVELWMVTRGQRLSTRPPAHPDEFHGRTGKPKSTPNQDITWLEAISTPDCRKTDQILTQIVDQRMPEEVPWYYLHIRLVYLGDSSDPALPGIWQQRDGPGDSIRLLQLESAMRWIVRKVGKRLIYWPNPEGAKGYVQRNESKRREARYYYIMGLESGLSEMDSIREAARFGKCTRRAVQMWRYSDEWMALRPEGVPPPPRLR